MQNNIYTTSRIKHIHTHTFAHTYIHALACIYLHIPKLLFLEGSIRNIILVTNMRKGIGLRKN